MSLRRTAGFFWLIASVQVAQAQDADTHVPPQPPAQTMPDMPPQQMADAMDMHDDAALSMFKLDQFEHAIGNGAANWEAEAWYGSDFDKLWLRTEGEQRDAGNDMRLEAFWDHAFSSFWDWQAGVRHDAGSAPARDWAAVGVQGIAPYWFEIEATAYVGDGGRSAARLRAEYELLFTQRLILQAEGEANFYSRSDAARQLGAGLSDASIGLRLRYEIRRELAPYVGVVRTQRFGERGAVDTQLVAGVRVWF